MLRVPGLRFQSKTGASTWSQAHVIEQLMLVIAKQFGAWSFSNRHTVPVSEVNTCLFRVALLARR